MEQKPNGKQILILNLVNNIPLAIIMSTVAPLIVGMPIVFTNWIANVLIAFVLACVINIVFPIPKMAAGIPKAFKLNPKSLVGRFVANIPIAALFVLIIGLILTFYNVRKAPDFIFAFLATALPLYGLCFIVAMFTNALAEKLAFGKAE